MSDLGNTECSDLTEARWAIYGVIYTYLTSKRFEYCVLWITYDHLYYAPCLACWAHFFHWYQQCVTVHHVPKCMSCHKPIVEVTRRAHCFYDCIYIYIYKKSRAHGLKTDGIKGKEALRGDWKGLNKEAYM